MFSRPYGTRLLAILGHPSHESLGYYLSPLAGLKSDTSFYVIVHRSSFRVH
jgi:hypothetical protein